MNLTELEKDIRDNLYDFGLPPKSVGLILGKIEQLITQKVAAAKEETAKRYEDALTEIDKNARTLQAGLCCYGTREGDKHTCDCKFYAEPEKKTGTRLDNGYFFMKQDTEVTGCCEARSIIWKVKEIREQVAQGKEGKV